MADTQPFDFAQIKGVQFIREDGRLTDDEQETARFDDVRRIPAAEPMIGPTPLWRVRIDDLKFMDNWLGFGTRILWSRESGDGQPDPPVRPPHRKPQWRRP